MGQQFLRRSRRTVTVSVLAVALATIGAPQVVADPEQGTPAPFTEEAAARGISYFAFPNFAFGYGSGFADLDNDGDPDIILLGGAGGLAGIFENDGTGNFIDRSLHNGIPTGTSISGVTAADYDGDRDLDLFLTNWYAPDILVRNDGNFQFTEVTAEAGLAADTGPGQGCSWGDYDGDGWVDLFVVNRTGSTEGNPGVDPNTPSKLFRNQGDGTFVDVTAAVGISSGDRLTCQSVWFDYENDGDADLYISNDKCIDGKTNRLWVNQGGTFIENSELSNAGVCVDSMGVATGDFDANGYQDLYATNTVAGNPLLLGQFDHRFIESSGPAAVGAYSNGWGTYYIDYDNDEWQELYVVNETGPNMMFDHDGSWPSASVGVALAVDDAGMGFGASYADVDLDGDLDMLVSNVLGPALLYINNEGHTRNWVRFEVRGRGNNYFGVGTVVEMQPGTVSMMREVSAGGSYKSQHEMPVQFGLGTHTATGTVDVRWTGGATRTLAGFPANQTWTLYPPEFLSDADLDHDVDRIDLSTFAGCYGPSGPGNLTQGCEMMDDDGDGDVDDDDYATFLARYIGPIQDCNGNGSNDLDDLIDGTSVDLDGNGVPDSCDAAAVPAGAIGLGSGSAGEQLTVARMAGQLQLDWPGSCASDTDYQIYSGRLGAFDSHTPVSCSSAGATTWTMDEPTGDRYFLIAPANLARQGSLGKDSNDAERPVGPASCLPQELTATCP